MVNILFGYPGGKPSPLDWSGTAYHLSQAFEKFTSVNYVSLPKSYAKKLPEFHPSFVWRRMLGKWMPIRSMEIARKIGREIRQMEINGNTVYFSTCSTSCAFVPHPIRTAYFSDSVMDQYYRLYGFDQHLTQIDLHRDIKLEQRCLERADAIFFSSRWAQSECQKRLSPASHSKVFVVGIGANLPLPKTPLLFRKPQPRLLWVGSEWKRKGGALAVNLFLQLRKKFEFAELTMIGDKPEDFELPSSCQYIPFLNKTDRSQCEKLVEAYISHDFLIHPTLADCSACVASEAQLYGCIPITTIVGGVSELILMGQTGYSFDKKEFLEKAYQIIIELCISPDQFFKMRMEAQKHAFNHLTWDVIAKKILDQLTGIFSKVSSKR